MAMSRNSQSYPLLTYLHRIDSSTITLWTGLSNSRASDQFLLLRFTEFSVFDANSVDPDQTLHPVASALGLH